MTGTSAQSRSNIIEAAVTRLLDASNRGVPCEPVRDLIGRDDIDLAYAIQQRIIDQRRAAGARIIGRKIGLTSPAVQQQLGVDRPDFGALFDDMLVPEGVPVPSNRLLQPKVEAEVAFVLSTDIDDGPLDEPQMRDAIDHAVPALEIVDSRIRDWDIAITDTIADNASSGLFILGTKRVSLDTFDPAEVRMSMTRDGAVVSAGNGRACLGSPLLALAWLARTARDYGSPLRAGDIILSGALGPMTAVTPGSTVRAELSVLGPIAATFSPKDIH